MVSILQRQGIDVSIIHVDIATIKKCVTCIWGFAHLCHSCTGGAKREKEKKVNMIKVSNKESNYCSVSDVVRSQ